MVVPTESTIEPRVLVQSGATYIASNIDNRIVIHTGGIYKVEHHYSSSSKPSTIVTNESQSPKVDDHETSGSSGQVQSAVTSHSDRQPQLHVSNGAVDEVNHISDTLPCVQASPRSALPWRRTHEQRPVIYGDGNHVHESTPVPNQERITVRSRQQCHKVDYPAVVGLSEAAEQMSVETVECMSIREVSSVPEPRRSGRDRKALADILNVSSSAQTGVVIEDGKASAKNARAGARPKRERPAKIKQELIE